MFLMVYFDQFGELGRIGKSRLETQRIWGFCSVEINLLKVACVID